MDTEGQISVAKRSVGEFVGVGLGGIYVLDGIREMPGATAKLCDQAHGLAQTWASEVGSGAAHNWPQAFELMRRCAVDSRSIPAQIDLAWGLVFAAGSVVEPWISGEPDRPLNVLDNAVNGFQGACAVGAVHLAWVLAAGVEVALDPVMWANMDRFGHVLEMVAIADMLVLGVWPTIKLMSIGTLTLVNSVRRSPGEEVEAAAVAKRAARADALAKRRALQAQQIASRTVIEAFPAQLEQVVADNEAERQRIVAHENYMGEVFPGDEGQARMVKVINFLSRKWLRETKALFKR